MKAIMMPRAIWGHEELASFTYVRLRMSVSLCLDYSSLALGEGPYRPLGACVTGSMLADLASEPLRVDPELIQAVRVGGVRSPPLALIPGHVLGIPGV